MEGERKEDMRRRESVYRCVYLGLAVAGSTSTHTLSAPHTSHQTSSSPPTLTVGEEGSAIWCSSGQCYHQADILEDGDSEHNSVLTADNVGFLRVWNERFIPICVGEEGREGGREGGEREGGGREGGREDA